MLFENIQKKFDDTKFSQGKVQFCKGARLKAILQQVYIYI